MTTSNVVCFSFNIDEIIIIGDRPISASCGNWFLNTRWIEVETYNLFSLKPHHVILISSHRSFDSETSNTMANIDSFLLIPQSLNLYSCEAWFEKLIRSAGLGFKHIISILSVMGIYGALFQIDIHRNIRESWVGLACLVLFGSLPKPDRKIWSSPEI